MPGKQKNKKNKRTRNNREQGLAIPKRFPLTTTTGRPAITDVLAYHTRLNLTEAAAGTGAYNTFRLTSIYDPDFTGVGTTALGYTTKSGFYGRYRVLKVRYSVLFYSNISFHTTVGLLIGGNSTFSSTPNNWAVEPNAKVRWVFGQQGVDKSQVMIEGYVEPHRVLGVTKQQFMTDNDFSSPFASNPIYPVYMHVWVVNDQGAVANISVDVRISFLTEFSQPLQSIAL